LAAPGWDNWLLWYARFSGAALVDASAVRWPCTRITITAIIQRGERAFGRRGSSGRITKTPRRPPETSPRSKMPRTSAVMAFIAITVMVRASQAPRRRFLSPAWFRLLRCHRPIRQRLGLSQKEAPPYEDNLVTGSSGLIWLGSRRAFDRQGPRGPRPDNNMRPRFLWRSRRHHLEPRSPSPHLQNFTHHNADIPRPHRPSRLFPFSALRFIVHCAAQPSTTEARDIPILDFESTPSAPSIFWKPRAFMPRSGLRFHQHQQGLWRPPTTPSQGARNALGIRSSGGL